VKSLQDQFRIPDEHQTKSTLGKNPMSQTNAQASTIEAVVIGAGPYGLSVAAHLAAAGVSFRIFGSPMSAWADQMPKGMLLKSEGFASSLSDPGSELTLGEFCKQQGLPYQDQDRPVELETFVAYGLAFQRQFVPNLDRRTVTSVDRVADGFEIVLEDGEHFRARKVVLAIGITQFTQVPEVLRDMPAHLVSHSSAHSKLEDFKGRHVAVLGAGASALDLAALLHRAGASVEVIARRGVVRFHSPPRKRSLRERILSPMTGIGMGWDLFFYVNAPQLFRQLPEKLRLDRMRKTLGPAPGWFIRDHVVGKVPLHVNTRVVGARAEGDGIALEIDHEGENRAVRFDHVIAATGYRVDLRRLNLLSEELCRAIRLTGGSPSLSQNFESSVPGLYFIGVTAANSFGPVMRFAVGAHYTAPKIAKHLAAASDRFAARNKMHGDAVSDVRNAVSGP
jgi:thioredoxin reductase